MSYYNKRDNKGRFSAIGTPITQVVKPLPPAIEVQKTLNLVAFVLDYSGSMRHLFTNGTMQRLWEEQLTQTKRDSFNLRETVRTVCFLSLFSEQNLFEVSAPTVPEALPFTLPKRELGSATALADAVVRVHNVLSTHIATATGPVSAMIVVLTDGQENASGHLMQAEMRRRITTNTNTSFAFVCPQSGKQELINCGVPVGNILTWDGSKEELEKSSKVMAQAASARIDKVSQGVLRTSSYFVDVAGHEHEFVGASDVRDAFKRWAIDKQVEIMPFVESHPGITYEPGRAYYQLTKPEKIQAHKDVVVRDKKTGKVVAQNVKQILGIKDDSRIKPGNLGNFDLFVRSTSMNRKLVPGTHLLYKVKNV